MKLCELRGDDEQPRARREPDDDRVRNEVDQRAEAREPHDDLDEADEQRERQHELGCNRALPGAASGAIVANTASEIVLVGPETWCHDEPHSAATTTGSIAQ